MPLPGTSGAEQIAAERARQVAQEGWTPAHDDTHDGAEMALAAAVYASPFSLRVKSDSLTGESVTFLSVWPGSWHFKGHPRIDGEGQNRRALGTFTPEQRIRDLVKAGALIAAEIDRLGRL